MHCGRCYREIEPGATVCRGCGLSFDATETTGAATPGGPAPSAPGRAPGTLPPPPGAGRPGAPAAPGPGTFGVPAYGPPPGYGPPGYGPPPGHGGPPGSGPPPGYGPPGYGAPTGPPRSSISTGRLVTIVVAICAVLVVIAAVLAARSTPRTTASRGGPVLRPPTTRSTRPPTTVPRSPSSPSSKAMTLEEAMLDKAGSLPPGATSFGPAAHHEANRILPTMIYSDRVASFDTSFRDSVQLGWTGAAPGGGTFVVTVIEMSDAPAAAELLSEVRASSALGESVPVQDAKTVYGFERRQAGIVTATIVAQQHSLVVMASVTVGESSPLLATGTPAVDLVIAAFTLQFHILDCNSSTGGGRVPPGC